MKLRWALLVLTALSLAACDVLAPIEPVPKPRTRPADAAEGRTTVPRPTSQRSAELRAYLAQVQSAQLTQGLLRQDGGGPDTPFTSDMLTRNFQRIAFFNEYSSLLPSGVAGQLRRWDDPVRMSVVFGASVPPSQRASDQADVTAYANRLARLTGHPIRVTNSPNFIVLIVSEDDRAEELARLPERIPGLNPAALAPLRSLPDDVYCAVAAFGKAGNRASYAAAVAVIRAENPDLLRLSCIHEELAQGLGLANDSPNARPSIFNDDDEFALLTTHDEILLRMLYDRRLKTGMTLREATPIIRMLARQSRGEAGPS